MLKYTISAIIGLCGVIGALWKFENDQDQEILDLVRSENVECQEDRKLLHKKLADVHCKLSFLEGKLEGRGEVEGEE